jgi:uncharacterized lipoprotein
MNLPDRNVSSEPRTLAVKRLLAVGFLIAVVCVTSGCNPFRRSSANTTCKEAEAYAQAQTIPSLKIPAGLESPDTRSALRVPDLSTPEPPPRMRAQGCLDEPPPYVIAKPKEPEA